MSQATPLEQYFLEFVNAERTKVGAQPLAFNGLLNDAARLHSQWMIDTDKFSHAGVGGTNAYRRMLTTGYSGGVENSFYWGENIAWSSARGPEGYNDEVERLHTNLMNSPGHKENLLNREYREVGLGFNVGPYLGWDKTAFVTQDFARAGREVVFLTGVAFADRNGNGRYDPGEGLGGVTVTAIDRTKSFSSVYSTGTDPAGGYSLALPAGTYHVAFTGAESRQVIIGSQSVKLDWIAPGSVTPPPPDPPIPPLPGTITGTAASETILGTPGKDTIHGLGGNDIIKSGRGADILTGGPGRDAFVFDTPLEPGVVKELTDFGALDWIRLDNDVFTNWGSNVGVIMSSQFHVGPAAHDTSDRIMHDPAKRELIYDPDGTGPKPQVTIAKVGQDAVITWASIVIIQ